MIHIKRNRYLLFFLILMATFPVSSQDMVYLVSLWDVATGEELRIDVDSEVQDAGWSTSGDYVAVVTQSAITIYDARTGEERLSTNLAGTEHPLNVGVSWNPGGNLLATWNDTNVRVLDVANGVELFRYIHEYPLLGIEWSPSGNFIVSWGQGQNQLWSIADASHRHTWVNIGGVSPIIRWHPLDDRAMLWSDGSGYSINYFNGVIEPVQPIFVSEVNTALRSGQWSSAGTHYYYYANNALFVSTDDGQTLYSNTYDAGIASISWTPGGDRLVVSTFDGILYWLDAETGETILSSSIGTFDFQINWSQDGTRILLTGDNPVAVDATTGEVLLRAVSIETEERLIRDWNADGTEGYAWFRGSEGYVSDPKIWNLLTGEVLHEIPLSYVFRADTESDQLVFWRDDGGDGLVLWLDLDNGVEVQSLSIYGSGMFTSVATADWNVDGSQILIQTSGAPGVGGAIVLNSSDGSSVLSAKIPCGTFEDAIWNRDESHILTWGFISC